VHVQPVAPKPDLFVEAQQQSHAAIMHEQAEPGPFIPPAPESPMIRPQRMPQIDDLPLPAQNQIRAQRGEIPPDQHSEAKRRTLLERLAAFGMSRQEEPAPMPQPANRLPAAPQASQHYRAAQPNAVHAEYGKRAPAPAPASRVHQQSLDQHGRLPQQRSVEEDQLEIPAFLRRQSS
jgi:cell division protein FtsZ